jgi:large subunit ribosomal protein L4
VASIKKFDLKGQALTPLAIEDNLLQKECNGQMIKDYIVALRANARQWSAHTKSRSEVSHSGQKPHPQKGTGRARQGYLGAPQYKGGGRVGTPRAKFDQHVSINRKEKKAAIRFLLAEKIQGDQMMVLDGHSLQAPRTKAVADFLKGQQLFGKKVLFVAALATVKADAPFIKSLRNIPGAEFMLLDNVSGYDILSHRNMIVMGPAVDQLLKILEG